MSLISIIPDGACLYTTNTALKQKKTKNKKKKVVNLKKFR